MTRLSRVLLGGVTGNPEDQLPNCRPHTQNAETFLLIPFTELLVG